MTGCGDSRTYVRMPRFQLKKIVKQLSLLALTVVVLLGSVLLLSGCQSTDQSECYLDTATIKQTIFEYDATADRTKVSWTTTLTNNTIYNFDGFSVQFKLYHEDTLVETKTCTYNKGVRHGEEYTGGFYFYADGEIDVIEYVAWLANYTSFWETYKVWLIATIIVAGIAALIYILVMIIQDLELDDTWEVITDFFEEHIQLALGSLVPIAGGIIWGIVASYWVPVLIVLGGAVAVVIVGLIAHLIKFISENVFLGGGFSGGNGRQYKRQHGNDDNYFDSENENVADYLDDKDTLILFSVEQLKNYCRENGIRGYSSLSKSELVDLISNTPSKLPKSVNTKLCTKVTFDDIAGLEEAKSAFQEKVVYALKHKEIYEKYGKKVGGGLLLYGLPGTGKTMFAEAASNATNSLFIPIKCSDIKSKWYGESEAKVKKIFEKARKAQKAIIFFDEFEAIGAKRTDDGDNGNNDLVPQILAEMQGIGSNNTNAVIMVIAATNKPWAIDSAFLRPGRFDEKIYVPLPDYAARRKLFALKLEKVPHDELDYEYLANITDGFKGADIGAYCDKLKMVAINKSIAANAEYPITMADVLQVQKNIKSSVSREDVERLLAFKEQYQ